MSYNKIRRIVKAQQGLQFNNFWTNPTLQSNLGGLGGISNPNPNMNGSTRPASSGISPIMLDYNQQQQHMQNLLQGSDKQNYFNQVWSGLKSSLPNLANKDTMNMGFGIVDSMIDTSDFSSTSNNIANAASMLGYATGNPGLGTAIKGAISLFTPKKKLFKMSDELIAKYGGSYLNIANQNENKVSKKQFNKLNKQVNSISDIADEAALQREAANNNMIYLANQSRLNGYTPTAKNGMKVHEMINLVKTRKLNSVYVNPKTKQVEEFKSGGVIEEAWEPVILDYFEVGGTLQDEWKPVIEFQEGGSLKKESESPEIEETTQKNVIPEGALHKNKHHMEHSEGLTKKGIPVVDNEGNQQAEIEHSEIIFTLEVTKFLEERYDKYYSDNIKQSEKDQLAIEAGELLVDQILNNTDDRTNLIKQIEV